MSDPAERAAERIAPYIERVSRGELSLAKEHIADIIRAEYRGWKKAIRKALEIDEADPRPLIEVAAVIRANFNSTGERIDIFMERAQAAESEVERLREPMPCGHPKACLTEVSSESECGHPHYGCTACEREASAVQARDRQWCSELAKQGIAARAAYPAGIEIEVPTIAEAVEAAREECCAAICTMCARKIKLKETKMGTFTHLDPIILFHRCY